MNLLNGSRHQEALRLAEQFFYLEADLLDDRRFDDWLDLLHPDLEYVMPLRRNVHSTDTDQEFTRMGLDAMWFDEGKETLSKRVRQLQTGQHWAEEPVSRSTHLVTNVRVVDVSETRIETSSRFLVNRNRVDTETDLFIGRRLDVLESLGDRWVLRRRTIHLDQSVLLAKNLTVFL